jgi:hypothetical protein
MVQLRETKIYCRQKCRQVAYRTRKGLPQTWKPDPTKRKVINGSYPNQPIERLNEKFTHWSDFTTQMVQTEKGLRKIIFNKETNEVTVFAIKDGKEILIK